MTTSAPAPASSSVLHDPRLARRQMAAMGVCYALGTFNDNFFKQAALLLAVTAGMRDFPGEATLLFALPFVLFSAWAGWAADRFSKKTLIVIAKAIEVAAMLAGAWGLVTLQWGWLLGMVFCMGCNSTLFSPALNSSVPELFPAERVPRVNAMFKLVTTATILLGIALAGFALDQHWFATPWPFGRVLVGAVALLAAVLGLAATAFLLGRPGLRSPNPFPWSGPLSCLGDLARVRRDAPLMLALLAEAFFYFLSTLLVLIINDLGRAQLGLSYSATSWLSVALLLGVCAGSFMAARSMPESSHRRPALAMLGVGLCLPLVCVVPLLAPGLCLYFLLLVYAAAGFCAGCYLIPLTSFIQLRPAATDKGRILGIGNFLCFTGILLSGQVFLLLAPLRPSTAHGLLGLLAAAFACYCLWAGKRHKCPDAAPCEEIMHTKKSSAFLRKGNWILLFSCAALYLVWVIFLILDQMDQISFREGLFVAFISIFLTVPICIFIFFLECVLAWHSIVLRSRWACLHCPLLMVLSVVGISYFDQITECCKFFCCGLLLLCKWFFYQ